MKELILASSSPRRKALLEMAGIRYTPITSFVSERTEKTQPKEIVAELSARKAQSVFLPHPEAIVLGADTMVALGDKIFGKPKTEEEAFEMLCALRNNVHRVYTGVTLVYADEEGLVKTSTHVEETDVHVGEATDKQLRDYIASGEAMDKAGAYGVQGLFCKYVKKIDGDYFNVVGLPVYYVAHELTRIREELGERD